MFAGCEHNAEGLLQRLRQADCGSGDHGAGQDLAPGALRLHPLPAGTRHPQLLRAGRQPVLRAGLPQPVQSTLLLLQRAHTGCKHNR